MCDYSIWRCEHMDELNDIRAHLHLYYGSELTKMHAWEREEARKAEAGEHVDALAADLASVGFKQASRSDPYTLCINAGLSGLAMKFGLTARQFAENWEKGYSEHHVEQYPFDPVDTATDYICRLNSMIIFCFRSCISCLKNIKNKYTEKGFIWQKMDVDYLLNKCSVVSTRPSWC